MSRLLFIPVREPHLKSPQEASCGDKVCFIGGGPPAAYCLRPYSEMPESMKRNTAMGIKERFTLMLVLV